MLKNDLPCLILAIFVWTSPLIIVFAADTLSIALRTRSESSLCPSIRTLNFEHEGSNDWNSPNTPENQTRIGLSLSTWNATNTTRDYDNPYFFDYWTSSSSQFQTVASRGLWGSGGLVYENASRDICGPGWNCSATIEFIAPGYNCTELTSVGESSIKDLDGQMPPFNLSDLAPLGNYTYLAAASEGAYPPQLLPEVHEGGMPKFTPPYPEDFGTFRTDPVIWVGYSVVGNKTVLPPNRDEPSWNSTYKPAVFGCVHHRTKYRVKFNWFSGGTQTYKVEDRKYLAKTINTTYVRSQIQDGTLDVTVAEPKENYVFPRDIQRYRVTAAYYSMGARLREMINGTVLPNPIIQNTGAINTRLLDQHNYLPNENMHVLLREMYEDLIVSLIGNPQFLIVSWASNSSKATGLAAGQQETDFNCERELTVNSFVYHRNTLWAVYAVGIGVASIGVCFGLVAAIQDNRGELREMIFSEIVSATRGSDLDEVRWDHHMDKKKVRVLYQKVSSEDTGKFVLRDSGEPEGKGFIRRSWNRGIPLYKSKSDFE